MTITDANDKTVSVISGDAINSVTVIPNSEDKSELLNTLFSKENPQIPAVNPEEQKQRVLDHFKLNRVPVKELENGVLTVLDNVTIQPPYTVDCCFSSNELILSRIRNLLQNMVEEK